MSDWKLKIQNFVEEIDNFSDDLRIRLKKIKNSDDPLKIIPYIGYGTADKFLLSGRVLEDKGDVVSSREQRGWQNFLNLYKHFATDEVAGARLRAAFQSAETEAVTDNEGYFSIELDTSSIVNSDSLFQEIQIELAEPLGKSGNTTQTVGRVLVPPATAQFGIISDLDDTVITTNVTNRLKMFLTVALLNEHTRMPFKGVAAFYKALQNGSAGAQNNPIFYVSSSPWNLYSPLTEFLRIHDIPLGSLFLKDFGSHTIFSSGDHHSHKVNSIELILNTYPHLPFVLIGDSGEQDPEIYREIVRKYPERIRVIYIRSIDLNSRRIASIEKLIVEISETGCQLVLAPDTVFAAVHAAAEKLISTDSLPYIRQEKKEDTEAPSAEEIVEETDLNSQIKKPDSFTGRRAFFIFCGANY